MGVAGPARLLVLGADVVPDVNGHQRKGVVLMKYDVQAVGKGELLEF